MSHVSLSTVIITKNEERNIEACLQSVGWVDEIIVVDAESSDQTQELARHYTPHVMGRPWEGYGPQKNYGIQRATREWILILDADERVSSDLAHEIQERLTTWTSNDPVAYCIPRRNIFYGEWVRWGGAYPDLQIRLFRNGKATYNDVEIHENLIVDGPIGTLEGFLEHYTERHIVDHFRKFPLYITLAAQERGKSIAMVRWWHLLLNPLVTFAKKYVLKQGFRDGIRGVIYAGFASMYTFGKYAKLWELACGISSESASKKS
ncbi:MAG: glycosyltransferase family 2 protein [Nitrospirales bacterium]